ncbi:MAG: nucleotidyltransferase family protein, partial [Acidobacteria bacterium]|nr:nucleotidyltransferase family protein [Acidobacteriota bacterium]
MAERANPKGQCWPDEPQELLLCAALLRGEDALSAWGEWRSTVDPDSLDAGSKRLLPLLYRNLRELGVNDPLVPRLKESYRITWSLNQSVFRQMASLLGSLHGAGIETLVLKGGALVPLYYRDYGVRPMVDFDILVREERAETAMDLLTGLG